MTVGHGAGSRAYALDYNGTLSDDELLLESIYLELFEQAGAPINAVAYRSHMLGLRDRELVMVGLRLGGMPEPCSELVAALLVERFARYAAHVTQQPTIPAAAVEAVRTLASFGPVAVVSGAPRTEITRGLAAAGLTGDIAVVVAGEDVRCGKPAPDPYRLAFHRLRRHVPYLQPSDVLVIEDAPVGIASARGAGLRCASVASGIGADVELSGLTVAALAPLASGACLTSCES
jgi:HAD superfamily hydrolase (TIGR01509 family)